jgi:lipoprotein-anchoring transpeptidase ErfK/SrfK
MGSGRRLTPVTAVVGLMLLLAGCTSAQSASTGSIPPLVPSSSAPHQAASGAPSTVGPVGVAGPGAGTASSASISPSSGTPPVGPAPNPALPAVAKVRASPAFGTTDMSPAQSVVVSVALGRITRFTLTNPDGKVVKGALAKDGSSWTLGEVLGYGKTYTATGSAVGTDGKTVAIKGSFNTVSPDTRVQVNVSPGDGDIVGVAAPVIVRFGVEPADRASIERNVTITTTPAVPGAWAWIQHDDGLWALDWRPKGYWPANTKVHVAANVYGLKFGPGEYGADDVTSDFSIGRNQVVYADARSFKIVVEQNGRTVAEYPASYGSGDDIGDPNRVTRSGIHVINEMLPVHKMSNPAYGYVNVTEYWDVRISDNGEFIHQNQGTVGDQGVVNVSHGCINLSAVNAKAYFRSALVGDPVEVTGTSVQLSAADGDLFDWTIPWDKWLKLSAL